MKVLVAAALTVLTFAVFFQVRGHEFVNLDDRIYIVENPTLRLGLGSEGLWHAIAGPLEAYWIPVTALSLQLDYALFGLEPAGWLLENVLLHALASIMLFLALERMTKRIGPSAFVAAVFAIHPLHVESVAWATERKDVLSGLWWMAALYAWIRAVEGGHRRIWELLAFGSFALSLLAKPGGVTFPFVLLLLDAWPLRRLSSRAQVLPRLVEKIPFFALTLVVAAIAVKTQADYGGMSFGRELPLTIRVENALAAYAAYLGQAFWPAHLAVFYPYPEKPPLGMALGGAGILAGVTLGAAWWFASRPYLLVGWLWFLGTLVPTIGLLQAGMQARADRFTYVPLVGLTIAFAWGLWDLGDGSRRRWRDLAAAACIGALAWVAWNQVGYWKDTDTLFERAIAVTEANYFAHFRLAEESIGRQDLEPALAHYEEAARFRPSWSTPVLRMAEIFDHRGDLSRAVDAYRRGVALEPFSPQHARRLAYLLSSDPAAAYHDPQEAAALRTRLAEHPSRG